MLCSYTKHVIVSLTRNISVTTRGYVASTSVGNASRYVLILTVLTSIIIVMTITIKRRTVNQTVTTSISTVMTIEIEKRVISIIVMTFVVIVLTIGIKKRKVGVIVMTIMLPVMTDLISMCIDEMGRCT